MTSEKHYPRGHFIGIGLATGIPLGMLIGFVLGNIALGPALGLPIGLVFGMSLEKGYNKNPIELSENEKKNRDKFLWLVFLLGLFVFSGVWGVHLFAQ